MINADECTSAAYRLAAGAYKERRPAKESGPEQLRFLQAFPKVNHSRRGIYQNGGITRWPVPAFGV
jgi:hypothetical protein